MKLSARLQILTCLMLCASSAQSIMVKYGTKGGPIEPATPEPPLPPPQPSRAPAPVWEERSNDSPDPNAQWRPQLFVPQPRYTQVAYKVPVSAPLPLNNAQRFVNSYIPINRLPTKAAPGANYFTPTQYLSSQTLPGFGLRYFVPVFTTDNKKKVQPSKHEDAHQNRIDTSEINKESVDSASDLQWKYEKDAIRRTTRNTQEAVSDPAYQWAVYLLPRRR